MKTFQLMALFAFILDNPISVELVKWLSHRNPSSTFPSNVRPRSDVPSNRRRIPCDIPFSMVQIKYAENVLWSAWTTSQNVISVSMFTLLNWTEWFDCPSRHQFQFACVHVASHFNTKSHMCVYNVNNRARCSIQCVQSKQETNGRNGTETKLSKNYDP